MKHISVPALKTVTTQQNTQKVGKGGKENSVKKVKELGGPPGVNIANTAHVMPM